MGVVIGIFVGIGVVVVGVIGYMAFKSKRGLEEWGKS